MFMDPNPSQQHLGFHYTIDWPYQELTGPKSRFLVPIFFAKEVMEVCFKFRSSVTRWIDYFLTLGHAQRWKFAQWDKKLSKVGSKFSQILEINPIEIAKVVKILQKRQNFAKPGHIVHESQKSFYFVICFPASKTVNSHISKQTHKHRRHWKLPSLAVRSDLAILKSFGNKMSPKSCKKYLSTFGDFLKNLPF